MKLKSTMFLMARQLTKNSFKVFSTAHLTLQKMNLQSLSTTSPTSTWSHLVTHQLPTHRHISSARTHRHTRASGGSLPLTSTATRRRTSFGTKCAPQQKAAATSLQIPGRKVPRDDGERRRHNLAATSLSR